MHDERLTKFILVPKPDWCKGMDIAVVAYLIAIADESGRSTPSQPELASAVGASTVNLLGLRHSLDRLHQHSWITWFKLPKAIGQRHRYEVLFENLPRKEDDETTGTSQSGDTPAPDS